MAPRSKGLATATCQGVCISGEGADGVPPGERRRESPGHHLRVEFQRVDCPEGESGVLRDCLGDVLFGKEPLGHQGRLVPGRRQPFDGRRPAGRRGWDAPLAAEERDQAGNRVQDGARARRCGRRGQRRVGGAAVDSGGGGAAARRRRLLARVLFVMQRRNLSKSLDVNRPGSFPFRSAMWKSRSEARPPPAAGEGGCASTAWNADLRPARAAPASTRISTAKLARPAWNADLWSPRAALRAAPVVPLFAVGDTRPIRAGER